MQNKIIHRFVELKKEQGVALVCYVVAGYPDIPTTLKIIDALVKAGADVIEIGIPFSDPIADGPTIQAASHHAIVNGITPKQALHLAKQVRKKYPNLPLIAMTYYNILIRPGLENFLRMAKKCGIDGFIVPDLPIEEAKAYSVVAEKIGLATIFLASPNTSQSRLRTIIESSTGFVYLVSVYGITGARKSFEEYTLNAIKSAKQSARGKIPIAVGFGISSPKHVKYMINAGADAVIVGSAILDKIEKSDAKTMLANLQFFIGSLKHACQKAR